MLSGEVTPMVGCPANSCHEAKNVVREANGFIAERDAAAGTLSVIRHWMQQES
jgi:hypothetical protein